MKKIFVLSVAAVIAMSSAAYAGGWGQPKGGSLVSVGVGNVSVLNGNKTSILNGASILSGIGNVSTGDVLNGNTLLNNVLSGNALLGGVIDNSKTSIKKRW